MRELAHLRAEVRRLRALVEERDAAIADLTAPPPPDLLGQVHLSRTPMMILGMLHRAEGRTVPFDVILAALDRANGKYPSRNCINVHIHRIRCALQLAKAPYVVVNENGIGYALKPCR